MGNLLFKYKWIAGSGEQKTKQLIITKYSETLGSRIKANRVSNKQVVLSCGYTCIGLKSFRITFTPTSCKDKLYPNLKFPEQEPSSKLLI